MLPVWFWNCICQIGQSSSHVICCIYVPPDSPLSYVSHHVLFLSDLVSSFSNCTFVGDFNLPDIDWFAIMGTYNSSTCLCDFLFDYNFKQHIFEPTHEKGNVLDLVLTSPCVSVTNLTIHSLSSLSFSDHFIITFDLFCNTMSVVESKAVYVFNYDGNTSFLLDSDFSIL